MSNTATEFAAQAQEQTLNSIRQSQQAVVETVHAWAQAVEKAVPESPSLPSLPIANELPSAQEIVRASFDFAEQLLKTQREFAENLIAAAAPVIEKAQQQES
jgi:hypothetical protein